MIVNRINEFERYAAQFNSLDEQQKRWIAWAKEKEVNLISEIDRENLNKRKFEF